MSEYTLGIKFYTNGEFKIKNYHKIGLSFIDRQTYFRVISWDDFDIAKENSVKMITDILENLVIVFKDNNRINSNKADLIHEIDSFLLNLENIAKDKFEEQKTITCYYLETRGTNLIMQFTKNPNSLDKNIKSFNLYKRFEKFVKSEEVNNIIDIHPNIVEGMNNLLKGKKYNDNIISDQNDIEDGMDKEIINDLGSVLKLYNIPSEGIITTDDLKEKKGLYLDTTDSINRYYQFKHNPNKFIKKPYRHFKGNLYYLHDIVKHTETEELLAIYQALYPPYETFARPLKMFTSIVGRQRIDNVMEQKYRFELFRG